MRRFLSTAAFLAVATAKPDPNPNNETEYSSIWWDNWSNSLQLNPRLQHIPLDPALQYLRPPPAQLPETFDIFIGSSVFRDGFRCGKTLFTALTRATYPERLHFGVLEQLYDGDPTCLDEYCKLAAIEWPQDTECRYRNQITVDTRDAAESAGCTTARHLQQKLVGNQEFCLQVDGHSIFTNRWDENVVADWASIDNEMAVLTMYPHHTHENMIAANGDNLVINSVPHLCTTVKGGNGLTRIVGASMISDSWMPQLAALWGGGFSFSKCHAERHVLVDSHTPWLWDGEEFLRSATFWTHGYDLYSPSRLGHVIFHNYSAKPASFWKSPMDPAKKALDTEMGANRVRLRVGLPFKGPVDTFELKKYAFGKVRSFERYLEFANISFDGWMNDTNSCGQLHWVPYENATAVEEIVGHGWKVLNNDAVVTKDEREKEWVTNPELELKAAVAHKVEVGETMNQAAPDLYTKVSKMQPNILVVFILAVVIVTISKDPISRSIRRRVCVARQKDSRAFE